MPTLEKSQKKNDSTEMTPKKHCAENNQNQIQRGQNDSRAGLVHGQPGFYLQHSI